VIFSCPPNPGDGRQGAREKELTSNHRKEKRMWFFSRNDGNENQLKAKAHEPKQGKVQQVADYYEELERATIVTKRRVIEYEAHWRIWNKKK
jgi:hypothetical protein